MSETEPNGAALVAQLAVAAQGDPRIVESSDGREFLLLPQGGGRYSHVDVSNPDRERFPPPNIRQKVTLQALDSLVDYVGRFKTSASVLFADIDASRIHAAIDYHDPAPSPSAAESGYRDHNAVMALPFSVEWQTWAAADGRMMGQLEFARFLEENAAEITAPTGAELLEVCRDLQAVRKVDFRKAVRTASDNESFEYVDDTTASSKSKAGAIEVPTRFRLDLPVYFGQPATELHAFLRWRLDEGEGLKLGVKLHRPEHVRQAVFKAIVREAAERLDLPAVFGVV